MQDGAGLVGEIDPKYAGRRDREHGLAVGRESNPHIPKSSRGPLQCPAIGDSSLQESIGKGRVESRPVRAYGGGSSGVRVRLYPEQQAQSRVANVGSDHVAVPAGI